MNESLSTTTNLVDLVISESDMYDNAISIKPEIKHFLTARFLSFWL